jgi:hypothetical protein
MGSGNSQGRHPAAAAVISLPPLGLVEFCEVLDALLHGGEDDE